MDRRLSGLESMVEKRVEERLEQELDAMISHLERELDDQELFNKVLHILANNEAEGK